MFSKISLVDESTQFPLMSNLYSLIVIPHNERCKLLVIKFVGNENMEEIIVDIQNHNDRMVKGYKSNLKYKTQL